MLFVFCILHLNFFRNKVDFRIAFKKYKQSLFDSICSYLRSNEAELLKPREPAYVKSESKIIEGKQTVKEFYEANVIPAMLDLQIYCIKQTYCSTPDFEQREVNPLYNYVPRVIPQPSPQPRRRPRVARPVAPVARPVAPAADPFAAFFPRQQFIPMQNQMIPQYAVNYQMPQQFIPQLQYQHFLPNASFQPYTQPPHQQFHQQIMPNVQQQYVPRQGFHQSLPSFFMPPRF